MVEKKIHNKKQSPVDGDIIEKQYLNSLGDVQKLKTTENTENHRVFSFSV